MAAVAPSSSRVKSKLSAAAPCVLVIEEMVRGSVPAPAVKLVVPGGATMVLALPVALPVLLVAVVVKAPAATLAVTVLPGVEVPMPAISATIK